MLVSSTNALGRFFGHRRGGGRLLLDDCCGILSLWRCCAATHLRCVVLALLVQDLPALVLHGCLLRWAEVGRGFICSVGGRSRKNVCSGGVNGADLVRGRDDPCCAARLQEVAELRRRHLWDLINA